MAYIKGYDRGQTLLFPECIEDYVEQDSPVRLFDAFVDSLDLGSLSFKRSVAADEGRPGYDPRDLLKLYIYGYFYSVRSSRKLARECKCNIEVMWLLRKLTPDFRTISDFRKDNVSQLKKVYKEFNRYCLQLSLFSKSYISIDGSKFKAVNAKDNNFTLNKLDDRIKRLEAHIAVYLAELDEADANESRRLSKDELEDKLKVAQERKKRYETMRQEMESKNESQKSVTDPDARLMKANEGFIVGYNTQTAVDAESHLLADYELTQCPTDHGQITTIASRVKEEFCQGTLEAVCDKGYECPEDQADALAQGIIPNVIRRDCGNETEITYTYNATEVTEEMKASTQPENLRKCLEAGVIPDAYKGILTDAQIVEKTTYCSDIDTTDADVLKMSPEQMLAKAKEGYFVRDIERNLVYCPQGNILRQKSLKRNGDIRYCNKLACKHCTCKCTLSPWKEADFNKDILIKPAKRLNATDNKSKGEPTGKGAKPKSKTKIKTKFVRYTLHLDEKKMKQRKCLSEHPFGTLKRTLGHYYFLLKGMLKADGEMALFCLSYNIRRAINMVGVPRLIAQMA